MLAESGIQDPSVLVGLVESEFYLGQVACVPIPVAFGFVPGRLDWILCLVDRPRCLLFWHAMSDLFAKRRGTDLR